MSCVWGGESFSLMSSGRNARTGRIDESVAKFYLESRATSAARLFFREKDGFRFQHKRLRVYVEALHGRRNPHASLPEQAEERAEGAHA